MQPRFKAGIKLKEACNRGSKRKPQIFPKIFK